jgi:hypothetical protein
MLVRTKTLIQNTKLNPGQIWSYGEGKIEEYIRIVSFCGDEIHYKLTDLDKKVTIHRDLKAYFRIYYKNYHLCEETHVNIPINIKAKFEI